MFRSRRWRFASTAIAALLGRQINAQPPTVAPHTVVPVGCYRLTLGPWSKESDLGPAQSTSVVRLDTIPSTRGVSGDLIAERIEPAQFAPPGDPRLRWQRRAHWRQEGADSVVIVTWSTGTEAEVFYGRWVGGLLRGVVRRTSDAIPVDPRTMKIQWDVWPWAQASAAMIRCP